MRDVLHGITYILLVVSVVPCIRHTEIMYWGYRVWPGMDELLDYVDPEGEVYISDAYTCAQCQPREKST